MTEQYNSEQPIERQPADTGAIFREQIPVMLAELAASGIMIGVYALLSRLTREVLLGAALGTGASILNYGVMILSLLRAEKAESPAKGQLMVRGMYMLRMIVLILVLVFALKSGYFDPVASLLPLVFMRLAIFAAELRLRKRRERNGHQCNRSEKTG